VNAIEPATPPAAERPRSITLPEFVPARIREFVYANSVVIKFLAVGAMGYLVYQIVVVLIYDFGLFPFLPGKDQSLDLLLFTHGDARFLIATLVATELSIIAVFNGHRLWTFRYRDFADKPLWIRFGQFNAKALVSTLGIVTVIVNILAVSLDVYHYIAVPVGVLVGFIWNWTWDTQIVWRRAKGSRTVV
jgi:putative flippase GtrA